MFNGFRRWLRHFFVGFGFETAHESRGGCGTVGRGGGHEGQAEGADKGEALPVAGFGFFQFGFAFRNGAGDGGQTGNVVVDAQAELFAHVSQLSLLQLGGYVGEGGVAGAGEGFLQRHVSQAEHVVVGDLAAVKVHGAGAGHDGFGGEVLVLESRGCGDDFKG